MDTKKYELMAKLDLDEAERQWLKGRMDCLVRDFSALESVDTSGIEPLVTVLDVQNIMREDIVKKWNNREELLCGAPDRHECFFRIPKALD